MEKKEEVTIEKSEKKKPISKIKSKNIIVVICGLCAILLFALFRMSVNQQKENIKVAKEEKKVESTTIDPDIAFQGINYSQLNDDKNSDDEIPVNTYKNSNIEEDNLETDTSNIETIESEVKKNEKLESYYETMLSDELSARSAVIEFGIENVPKENSEDGHLPKINVEPDMSSMLARNQVSGENNDMNRQAEKKAFLNNEKAKSNYNDDVLTPALSKYEIKAGGIIPGIMLTGINSDLPGSMIANVREDVYDTVRGRYLLIPKGTRVIGKYSSSISFGQSRVLVVWQRLIFPNGKSINLENFEGADMSGYAGLVGTVDNHTLKLFQGVVLSSILGATAGVIDDKGNSNEKKSWKNGAGRGAGEEIVTIGETIANRFLSLQPTIKINPGSRFNIMVNSDLILEPYK